MTDHDATPLNTQLNTPLGSALRERVRDEDPDLDELIRVSTRAGSRIRRRRTVGVSLAAAAATVTVVGIVGAALGGSGDPTGSKPGVANEPTAATSSPAASATPTESAPTPETPRAGQDLPVHVDPALRGWQIGMPGDDKFPATKGNDTISVNVRSLEEYDAWSGGDPDRPGNQVVHVGANYFVTVQPLTEAPPDLIAELTGALRYDATWDRKGANRAQ